ncbi:beta-galactosidase [Ruania zhangjianzhongii]|uniref:beta-galactosidase n=1 Tax=Ruania zhangjianzhongii TaxID=2603206 RepID=UPI001AEFE59D|nr:beta-galactosidase [Ruania zhangjianzhongii]
MGVGFGAAYYTEYQPSPRLAEDMRLMQEAGFSVIRVGESTWSTWEPEDGRFETGWMTEVLDAAHSHGIEVLLGTPTYAVPPWLARAHPEIAAETKTGVRRPWGARQEIDITHPTFRQYAERVIATMVTEFADHPAVVGYQLDNEPGVLLLHNEGVFAGFKTWLANQFDDVTTINDRWGLAYWSHRLSTWDDLWRPDGNAQPQYDLAWRLYQAEVVAEFIAWQARIMRELARPEQWLTTCIAYDRVAADDLRIAAELDIASGNAYYRMQDGLAHPATTRPQTWMSDGTWSVFLQADRMFGSKQAPFLVTETNAGAINFANVSEPGWDGQWRQAAWAQIGRGARLIEYWHWHTNHYGTETHWVGVLPHDQLPGRVYRNIAELGQEIQDIGERVAATTPDADLAFVFSTPSKYALAFEPVFGDEGAAPHSRGYQRIFEAFYKGAFDAGLQAHVLHDRALPSGAELAERYPVLVVPGLYSAPDGVLATLREYHAAGGHLVLGPRTGYADEWAVVRRDPQPGGLADLAGTRYQEFTTLRAPVPIIGRDGATLGAAHGWTDLLEPDVAEPIARFDHPELGAFAAATTMTYGPGRVTTVGFVPDDAAAVALLETVSELSNLRPFRCNAPSVTHSSATGEHERLHFYFNWSGEPVTIGWPAGQHSDDGSSQPQLELGAWDVQLLWE